MVEYGTVEVVTILIFPFIRKSKSTRFLYFPNSILIPHQSDKPKSSRSRSKVHDRTGGVHQWWTIIGLSPSVVSGIEFRSLIPKKFKGQFRFEYALNC